ncbi:hypothetical protein [Corticicoccus populi]|uniref:DUF4229 domain-containing protein n=1 Tax=Corticicoccus populi TaxID=1812821 RepID=A0ABW5WQX4_9STAP
MRLFKALNWITALLLILQLFNTISISWWLVFLPSIIYFGILFLLMLVIGIAIVVVVITTGKSIDDIDADEIREKLNGLKRKGR